MSKIGIGILGATGVVGQELIKRLISHPDFEIRLLAASPSSAGKKYADAVKLWYTEVGCNGIVPKEVANQIVVNTDAKVFSKRDDIDIVFSALPPAVSMEIEPELASMGITIISKSSAFRMEPDVPLLIPEVNPEHLQLLDIQRKKRGWDGAMISDPNCSTTELVLAVKPLHDAVGIKKIFVSTMQATSGAGFMGNSPLAINDNVIPYISGEEDKLEKETQRILGTLSNGEVVWAPMNVSATCCRVNVKYGHTETVFVETDEPCTPKEAAKLMREYRGLPQTLGLHSAPQNPIVVREQIDRPQPMLDIHESTGMGIVVGRIREDPAFDNGLKFVIVGHNTVRGAAGTAILNAEMICHEAAGVKIPLPLEEKIKSIAKA